MLYIGANTARFHFADKLRTIGTDIDVLEIDPDRCNDLRSYMWIRRIIQGDVVNAANCIKQQYDCVLWSHGPEILQDRGIIFDTIDMLSRIADEVLVTMCPWGQYGYEEGEKGQLRESDINKTALYPCDFLTQGFAVSCLGFENIRGSNMLAWKYKEN